MATIGTEKREKMQSSKISFSLLFFFFFFLSFRKHVRELSLPGSAGGKGDNKFLNCFALGSFVNHPPPRSSAKRHRGETKRKGEKSHISDFFSNQQVPFEFPENTPFVPHDISRKKPLYLLDSFDGKIPSVLLVASRNVKDEGDF